MSASVVFGDVYTNNENIINQLKAVYLEKFSLFTDWPSESKIYDKDKPFIIDILGEDSPLSQEIKRTFQEENISILNKKVKFNFIEKFSEITDCHILFITENSINTIEEIADFVKTKPILVISDVEGDAQKGAHINFYLTSEGKLHFEINANVARSSRVQINSRLLRIAKIIE
ncbi:MAG: YfiR family protein [Melioribacteraceae bacterium]|nr:YfiR family protein [Melioribacteraceae bacterium]